MIRKRFIVVCLFCLSAAMLLGVGCLSAANKRSETTTRQSGTSKVEAGGDAINISPVLNLSVAGGGTGIAYLGFLFWHVRRLRRKFDLLISSIEIHGSPHLKTNIKQRAWALNLEKTLNRHVKRVTCKKCPTVTSCKP